MPVAAVRMKWRESVLRRVTSKTGQGLLRSILSGDWDRNDKGYPSESDSRDGTRDEALARTQVYLSKTKLRLQVGI